MELNTEIKRLLTAYEMASLTDFVDPCEADFYVSELGIMMDYAKDISSEFEGNGISSIEGKIIHELNKHK